MRKNDNSVFVVEKNLLFSPVAHQNLDTRTELFLNSTVLHSLKQDLIIAREPIRILAIFLNTTNAFSEKRSRRF